MKKTTVVMLHGDNQPLLKVNFLVVMMNALLFCSTALWAADAPVPKSGQTMSFVTGDDGDLESGVVWPTPRFTDGSDGTVIDNLTGLIWLQNADCSIAMNWDQALWFANSLYDGWTGDPAGTDCGLSDGSNAGDWRLPGIHELASIIHAGYSNPALSNAAGDAQWAEGDAFYGVRTHYYWSSTTYVGNTGNAWRLLPNNGADGPASKTNTYYVWPVRGGQ